VNATYIFNAERPEHLGEQIEAGVIEPPRFEPNHLDQRVVPRSVRTELSPSGIFVVGINWRGAKQIPIDRHLRTGHIGSDHKPTVYAPEGENDHDQENKSWPSAHSTLLTSESVSVVELSAIPHRSMGVKVDPSTIHGVCQWILANPTREGRGCK
jgi:hypothetical protein